MHPLIMEKILDGDVCHRLEKIEYSTNPRKLVTLADMFEYQSNIDRMEKRVLEVMGA